MLNCEIDKILKNVNTNPRQATDFELVFVLLMRLFSVDCIRASNDKSQIEVHLSFSPQGKIKGKRKYDTTKMFSELLSYQSFQALDLRQSEKAA